MNRYLSILLLLCTFSLTAMENCEKKCDFYLRNHLSAIGARHAALAGSCYKAFQRCMKTCNPLKPSVQKTENNSQAKSFEEKLATARFFAQ